MDLRNLMLAMCLLGSTSAWGPHAISPEQREAALRNLSVNRAPITDTCFRCLCKVSGTCGAYKTCGDGRQGPYCLTHSYWFDSGSPTVNTEAIYLPEAYAHCVNDEHCARRTIQRYMDRFAQDCDFNWTINCDDYLPLQLMGKDGCFFHINAEIRRDWDTCMRNSEEPINSPGQWGIKALDGI